MSEVERCYRCNEILKPGREVWLELDTRTGRFTMDPIEEEHSQGFFAFGAVCAIAEIKETRTQEESNSSLPLPAEQLVKRAVVNARPAGGGVRWAGVRDAFALGSTCSKQLCRWAGVDPEDQFNSRGALKR